MELTMVRAYHPTTKVPNRLLTIGEAAALLQVSRPYASMLCAAGRLGEIVATEDGHRLIGASAVDAYLAARIKQNEGALLPRAAGVDAGIYDYPEDSFQEADARARPLAD